MAYPGLYNNFYSWRYVCGVADNEYNIMARDEKWQ